MNRRLLRDRVTALMAAVLFLLSGAGDAFGAHACPHHAAIGAPAAAHGAAAHHGPAAADHGHGAHSSAPASPAEHDGHAACTCGGVCPVGAGAAPLPSSASGHLAILVATAAAPAARTGDAELPSRLVPHFLPFSQAPPRQA